MAERSAVEADLGIKATHAEFTKDGVDSRSLQAYLGHHIVKKTERYTALAPDRYKRFWRD